MNKVCMKYKVKFTFRNQRLKSAILINVHLVPLICVCFQYVCTTSLNFDIWNHSSKTRCQMLYISAIPNSMTAEIYGWLILALISGTTAVIDTDCYEASWKFKFHSASGHPVYQISIHSPYSACEHCIKSFYSYQHYIYMYTESMMAILGAIIARKCDGT